MADPEAARELVQYLSVDSDAHVCLALEHVAALTGTDEGAQCLIDTGAIPRVRALCVEHSSAEARGHAAAALANVCAASAETCEELAGANELIAALCTQLVRAKDLAERVATSALLANLTTRDAAASTAAEHADALVDALLGGAEDESSAHVALVLVNVSQLAHFATFVLRDDAHRLVRLLDAELAHARDARREGVAGVVKNLCINKYNHAVLLRAEAVLPRLAARLLPPGAAVDAEDLARMSPATRAALEAALAAGSGGSEGGRGGTCAAAYEPVAGVRLALTEALLALTVTRAGREALRAAHVYPALRESHKAEPDEAVQAANEELVSMIMADEAPPARAAGADALPEPSPAADADAGETGAAAGGGALATHAEHAAEEEVD